MDINIFKPYLENPVFKQFHPFLKLATSCATTQPCISYWAVYYCCDHGMKLNSKEPSAQIKKFIETMILCLEKEKESQKQFGNDEQQKTIVEKYGNQLFLRAEDEAELDASPTTAIKIYISAANVFQLMDYFLKDDQSKADNAKRIKYCKWKAVTIAKKAKEQQQEETRAPSQASSDNETENSHNIPTVPTNVNPSLGFNFQPSDSSLPPPPSSAYPPSTPSNYPSFAPEPAPRASVPQMPSIEPSPIPVADFAKLSLSDSDIRKAELLCESALYAIKSNDLYNAVTGLQQSLHLIYKAGRENRG